MSGPDKPLCIDGAEVDLTNCDREPIHILGRVQSYGCLVAASSDWIIRQASTNTHTVLGLDAETIIGTRIVDQLPSETLHRIRSKIQTLSHQDAVARMFGLDVFGDGRRFDLAVHLSGESIVLEFERVPGAHMRDDLSAVQPIIARIRHKKSFADFAEEAARGLSALSGFDRVMVYKFDEDGTGTVVAETLQGDADGYMGLRFPASDIPRQARKLYERNLIRIIPDVDGENFAIVPNLGPNGEALDLSLAMTRAVSQIHLEYLRNMGVAASMSVSILRKGKLWGLFACHHSTPHFIDYEARTAIELFAQLFSYELGEKENEEHRIEQDKAQDLREKLLSQVTSGADIVAGFQLLRENIGEIIPFDGMAIYSEGKYVAAGSAPSEEEFIGLARFLNSQNTGRVFATDCLSRSYSRAGIFGDRVAGVLALPISRSPADYIVLFRREVATVVDWSGNPEKPVVTEPGGTMLSPRRSFAVWQEVKKFTSVAWSESEIRAAESLRFVLLEVVLKLADEAKLERSRAQDQQELLIAELNHRVRNILNLIRGLVSQGRNDVDTIEDFTSVLDSRIQALARAHDQLTETDWTWASLSELILVEADAFGGTSGERVAIHGTDVLLAPEAFSPMALVVHELVTNSAKYGALSDSRGRVEIVLEVNDDGSLNIRWRDVGGPPVKAPTRRGFGLTIIECTIPFELRGTSEVHFRLNGFAADFCLPSAHVKPVKQSPAVRREAPATPIAPLTLSGEVLLVEDNMIIAMDAADILNEFGAARVHTVSSVKGAMRVLDKTRPEIAILDVNLGSETSVDVAARLREMEVPFVVATGYGETDGLDRAYPGATVVRKPYVAETLRRALATARA